MASFLNFWTPRPSSKRDLPPPRAHSSPLAAIVRDTQGQPQSRNRKRKSRGASIDLGSDSVAPLEELAEAVSPKRRAFTADAVARSSPPAGAVKREAASPEALPVPQEPERASEDGEEDLYMIESIKSHRWDGDLMELRVKWETGETTWEPEANLQQDVPAVLFSYWKSVGGRPDHPSDPDLFHIFAVHKTKKRGEQVLVEWLGYKEQSWEPRSTVEEAAPELLKELEARQSRPRKRQKRT